MEDKPSLYTLPPSYRTRSYPQRTAYKTHIIAPCNSPASSTISNQFASVTRYDRKQRRVRCAGTEASVRSTLRTVKTLHDSVRRESSTSLHVNTEISSSSIPAEPAVHYSKERDSCQITPAKTVPGNTSCRPVVLQIEDNVSNINTPNKSNERISVENVQKSSSKEVHLLGIQSKKKCRLCLKSYMLASVAVRNEDQAEITTSTHNSNFIYREIALPPMHADCTVESKKWRGFYMTISWVTTFCGLASYVYMLLLAFSSNAELMKQRSLFPLAVFLSNLCLMTALYCNCML